MEALISARLAQIIDGHAVGAVHIWLHHTGGWLGSLIDGRNQVIPGSTPWNPCPTFDDLIDTLATMADTYRQEHSC